MRHVLCALALAMSVSCGSSSLEMMPGAAGGGRPSADGGAGGGSSGGGSAGSTAGGGLAGGDAGGAAGGEAGGSAAGGAAGGLGGGDAGGAAAGGSAGGASAGGSAGGSGGGAPGCSSATCATGCCLNGTCQPGTQPLACGTNAVACATCMMGTTCQQQQCLVDPASMWRIAPVSAQIAMRKANGDTWDTGGGLPDVFVTVFCPATAGSGTRTPTIDDTLTPRWTMGSCVMTASALQMTGFAFSVTDDDPFLINPDDTITSKTTVRLMPSDFTAPTLVRGPVGQTTSITFSLTRM
ncbi:MAG: hypothetical protein SFW67_00745 [Myxococcaceae bacterium]|nr:hypothetical protein [Myxococcaceae bacterium]